LGFIQTLPSDLRRSGPGWIHEIKHDGYRLMARRDAAGLQLLTRNGIDWSFRFPRIVQAVGGLRVDRRRGDLLR
jgi:ATP-dependent DNA ligase